MATVISVRQPAYRGSRTSLLAVTFRGRAFEASAAVRRIGSLPSAGGRHKLCVVTNASPEGE